MFSIFTPRWKKEAKHLHKGGKKFLHYKRDLLEQDRIDEIEARRADLLAAIKAGDRKAVDEASKQLKATCEGALPRHEPQGWFEENVEVIFVAIVIALGLRAYFLQPFRIPTGSMQPSLNGIVGKAMPKEEWPAFPVRIAEYVLRGRSYVRVVNKRDRPVGIIQTDRGPAPALQDTQWLHFFSRSVIGFGDRSTVRLPAPASQARILGLDQAIAKAMGNGGIMPAGTVLCEGTVDAGDLVLVDKVSYHFRRPKRGESFVFDTRGIRGIHDRHHSSLGGQEAGSHYIKRLCGVPGDTLSIDTPNLLIKEAGEQEPRIAQEATIQRVIRAEGPYSINNGYQLADPAHDNGAVRFLDGPGKTLELKADVSTYGLREYAALGDNTGNSLDSRYWGKVKEFNLVGPALLSLWPITTGHWGLIE
jgi:signal peptidase I